MTLSFGQPTRVGLTPLRADGQVEYGPRRDDLLQQGVKRVQRLLRTEGGRIRLPTSVLLAPLHTNTALFAKQAASLDRISGGRLVLGLGIGGREDDVAASGLTMAGRGRRFDEQLAEMQRIWAGEGRRDIAPMGPPPARPGGPELILGGSTEASFRRVACVAGGWTMGGGTWLTSRWARTPARWQTVI